MTLTMHKRNSLPNWLTATILVLSLSPSIADAAQEIASCGAVSGHSFFNSFAMVPADKAGWQKDAITGGATTIVRKDDGKYDILVLDATKQIKSLRDEGGEVMLVRAGPNEAAFLYVTTITAEIYTIWKDAAGRSRIVLLQSKGFPALFGKGSLLVGSCSFFDLTAVQ